MFLLLSSLFNLFATTIVVTLTKLFSTWQGALAVAIFVLLNRNRVWVQASLLIFGATILPAKINEYYPIVQQRFFAKKKLVAKQVNLAKEEGKKKLSAVKSVAQEAGAKTIQLQNQLLAGLVSEIKNLRDKGEKRIAPERFKKRKAREKIQKEKKRWQERKKRAREVTWLCVKYTAITFWYLINLRLAQYTIIGAILYFFWKNRHNQFAAKKGRGHGGDWGFAKKREVMEPKEEQLAVDLPVAQEFQSKNKKNAPKGFRLDVSRFRLVKIEAGISDYDLMAFWGQIRGIKDPVLNHHFASGIQRLEKAIKDKKQEKKALDIFIEANGNLLLPDDKVLPGKPGDGKIETLASHLQKLKRQQELRQQQLKEKEERLRKKQERRVDAQKKAAERRKKRLKRKKNDLLAKEEARKKRQEKKEKERREKLKEKKAAAQKRQEEAEKRRKEALEKKKKEEAHKKKREENLKRKKAEDYKKKREEDLKREKVQKRQEKAAKRRQQALDKRKKAEDYKKKREKILKQKKERADQKRLEGSKKEKVPAVSIRSNKKRVVLRRKKSKKNQTVRFVDDHHGTKIDKTRIIKGTGRGGKKRGGNSEDPFLERSKEGGKSDGTNTLNDLLETGTKEVVEKTSQSLTQSTVKKTIVEFTKETVNNDLLGLEQLKKYVNDVFKTPQERLMEIMAKKPSFLTPSATKTVEQASKEIVQEVSVSTSSLVTNTLSNVGKGLVVGVSVKYGLAGLGTLKRCYKGENSAFEKSKGKGFVERTKVVCKEILADAPPVKEVAEDVTVGTVGCVVGQALIPIPVVGGVVGGIVGGLAYKGTKKLFGWMSKKWW